MSEASCILCRFYEPYERPKNRKNDGAVIKGKCAYNGVDVFYPDAGDCGWFSPRGGDR